MVMMHIQQAFCLEIGFKLMQVCIMFIVIWLAKPTEITTGKRNIPIIIVASVIPLQNSTSAPSVGNEEEDGEALTKKKKKKRLEPETDEDEELDESAEGEDDAEKEQGEEGEEGESSLPTKEDLLGDGVYQHC